MRSVLAILLSIAIGVTGCSTMSGADVVERIIAGATCLTALVNAGIQVSGDPLLAGAVTASNVMNTISTIGASNLPGTVMTACKSTIDLASKDAAGLSALLQREPPAAGPVAPTARKAPTARIAKPTASPEPTVIKVPLR